MFVRNLEWHAVNGDIIRFGKEPPYLLDRFVPGTPSGNAETVRAVRADGQTTYHVAAEPLTPSLTGTLVGVGGTHKEKQTSLDRQRLRLQAALDPKRFGTLVFTNFAGAFKLRCRPLAGANFGKRFAETHPISIDWMSDDPYWTERDERTLSVGLVHKLWRFPWAIAPTVFGAITNEGTINNPTHLDIYPTIVLSDTESESITVGNATTGEFVTITHTIQRGQRLVLDMSKPSVTLVDADGAETDVMHWTTLDSIFPWAVVPGDNAIYSNVDNPELSPVIRLSWYLPEVGL